jgi:murein DD-endopeptidase MepM/ murein hydrolase activator NlpD
MKIRYVVLVAVMALASACTQQATRNVVHKGNDYYGRDSRFVGGTERPIYSDSRRATQNPQIANKYLSRTHEYGVAAAVSDVEVSTLPAPDAISVSDTTPASSGISSAPMTSTTFGSSPQLTPLSMNEPLSASSTAVETASSAEIMSVVEPAKQPPALDPINTRQSNFIWPVNGDIVSRFGKKPNGLVNDGINIAAPEGEPVWAAAKGEVVYSGNELKGYGNMLIIRHDNGWMSAYAHTSDTLVKKGDKVNQGDLIGYVGKTGSVTSSQLHFGIRDAKGPMDPESLLPKRVASAR